MEIFILALGNLKFAAGHDRADVETSFQLLDEK